MSFPFVQFPHRRGGRANVEVEAWITSRKLCSFGVGIGLSLGNNFGGGASVPPSTVDFSVAQIGSGIIGVTDPGLTNAGHNAWFDVNTSGTWHVTGTDCILFCAGAGGPGTQPFGVSVDGGAFTFPINDGSKITAFSGLPNVRHLLRVSIDPGSRFGSAWTPTVGTLLSVTGSGPNVQVIGAASYCQDVAWPGKDMSYTVAADGGNWIPNIRKPDLGDSDQRSFTGFTRRFSAKASEIWLHTGEPNAMYSIDGGAMQEVTFAFTNPPPFFGTLCSCLQLLATGLDLTAFHEYKIVNQTSGHQQEFATIDAIILVGSGASFSVPPTKPKLMVYGTSVTNGINAGNNAYSGAQWFQYAANTVGGVDVIGNGHDGVTAAAADTELTAILANPGWIIPDRVLIELGANDIATDPTAFKASLTSIYNKFVAVGVTKVAFEYKAPNDDGTFNAVNVSIGQVVTAIGDSTKCRAIDTALWLGIATADGSHPTLPGYITMGNYLIPDANFTWLVT